LFGSIKDSIYYYNINDKQFGPYCEKCAEEGIKLNVVYTEDDLGNITNLKIT